MFLSRFAARHAHAHTVIITRNNIYICSEKAGLKSDTHDRIRTVCKENLMTKKRNQLPLCFFNK
ncbi:hypothetical protein BN136_2735 [Cronobacter universalis NCTC 9529]|nr:hypothetical protein BN136_2735 [Cronobacter universalis NCTC 9529]